MKIEINTNKKGDECYITNRGNKVNILDSTPTCQNIVLQIFNNIGHAVRKSKGKTIIQVCPLRSTDKNFKQCLKTFRKY